MNGSNDHILKKFLRRLTPIPLHSYNNYYERVGQFLTWMLGFANEHLSKLNTPGLGLAEKYSLSEVHFNTRRLLFEFNGPLQHLPTPCMCNKGSSD